MAQPEPPVRVRLETPHDYDAVHALHEAAFGRAGEARLVDLLRRSPAFIPDLSLVAVDRHEQERVLGHVILTRVTVDGRDAGLLGLGPIGVLPERQRTGIGSLLMRKAIRQATDMGYSGIVLLGHPTYYPRFGFSPASRFELTNKYGIAGEAFMALALAEGSLAGISGLMEYAPEFDAVTA